MRNYFIGFFLGMMAGGNFVYWLPCREKVVMQWEAPSSDAPIHGSILYISQSAIYRYNVDTYEWSLVNEY